MAAASSANLSSGIESTLRVRALGEMAFTGVPNAASSYAVVFVKPMMPAFAAALFACPTLPRSPVYDVTLTMRPLPGARMCGTTARVERKRSAGVRDEDVVAVLVRQLPYALVTQDAGVVHQHVDPAGEVDRLLDSPIDVLVTETSAWHRLAPMARAASSSSVPSLSTRTTAAPR